MPATAIHRQTLARPARFEGTGIHKNVPGVLEVLPAEKPGAGLLLRRAGSPLPDLPATVAFANAEKSDRRTVVVGKDGQVFEQFEHVMAALAAIGITDAILVQSGPEPPFLDGGSKDYMEGLLAAGVRELNAAIEPLVVREPIVLSDGGVDLVATPHEGLLLSVFVEFPGTVVGSQGFSLEITAQSFREQAAPARTFTPKREIERMRAAEMGKGGNLENTVVFDESGYLNDSLRFGDEVVRHKIVDLLGDLALIGRPLRGHFWASKAGHRHHVRFAQLLAERV